MDLVIKNLTKKKKKSKTSASIQDGVRETRFTTLLNSYYYIIVCSKYLKTRQSFQTLHIN